MMVLESKDKTTTGFALFTVSQIVAYGKGNERRIYIYLSEANFLHLLFSIHWEVVTGQISLSDSNPTSVLTLSLNILASQQHFSYYKYFFK
jgi:hypothetical protein